MEENTVLMIHVLVINVIDDDRIKFAIYIVVQKNKQRDLDSWTLILLSTGKMRKFDWFNEILNRVKYLCWLIFESAKISSLKNEVSQF